MSVSKNRYKFICYRSRSYGSIKAIDSELKSTGAIIARRSITINDYHNAYHEEERIMYETMIIGAGIAGLTAGIYAARKKMDFLCLAKQFGGQVLESGEILNYPGIVETNGFEFYETLRKQAEFNKIPIHEGEEATRIGKRRGGFFVVTNRGEYHAKSIILATGARAKKLNIPGENRLANRGVTYCAICDGPLFAGREVAVIGGGNSALEAADYLMQIAKRIYLVNIGSQFDAHEYLIETITSNEKVNVIPDAHTTAILGEKTVEGIEYEQYGEKKSLKVQGVFVEIGRSPNTEFLQGFVDLDIHNHVLIDCNTRTSVDGVFAAGDCSSIHEYQYTIAAGQGCTALLKVAKYLHEV
ncbi:MAG: FAD-dependent oxidoreductase [bacterium]